MLINRLLWIVILAPLAFLGSSFNGAWADEVAEEIPEELSLECREFEAVFYTILSQEDEGIPLLTYQSVASPEATCREATENLNGILSGLEEAQLSTLLLRTGTVRSQDVVCAVFRVSSGCTSRNFVVNIPAGENPADFLEGLLPSDVQFFSLGDPNQHTRRRTYAQFGQGIQRKLKVDEKLTH